MTQPTYGKLWHQNGGWALTCEPHVAMWLKRMFPRISKWAQGIFQLSDTPAVAADLEWFLLRFPMEIPASDERQHLADQAALHRQHVLTMAQITGEGYTPQAFEMALPPREYQRQAAELFLKQGYLLLADDVGLGKTVSAIAAFTNPETLPVAVVTLAHLPRQWEKEVNRFMPGLFVHVVKTMDPYELPRRHAEDPPPAGGNGKPKRRKPGQAPDVLIISYYKLAHWADVLARYCKTVVFDEIQELRREDSQKYLAAKHVAHSVQFRLGLSATPIYNYGGEIYNVLTTLNPDLLGSREEFKIEWCNGAIKESLREPVAFGSWARAQYAIMRRTRADVKRELPPLQRIPVEVEHDPKVLEKIEGTARGLAEIIMATGKLGKGEKFHAAEEFNNLMRQTTGIAKAPFVAAFVRLLIENGERVLLYGWHRAVYEIWLSKLQDFEPALYTGSEGPDRKSREAGRFMAGKTPLLIMSLRSGAGVDGLQHSCRTVVVGELDWSPGVHEQNVGRIYRDGQPDPVTAYFCLATEGADPIMAEVLGIKRDQIEGVRDPDRKAAPEIFDASGATLRKLAQDFLNRQGKVTKRKQRRGK